MKFTLHDLGWCINLTATIIVYPSFKGDTCFVTLAQPGLDKEEHPIGFVARYLKKTELKYGILTTLVSVTGWVVK